ncbi:hypothetical protein J437_LFUL003876 [Ladona fulva]|uniref:Uncharacterized protein n=1 Tax=Ladona fulva TaxID=123851 RepID=A0A8K0K9K0_LADFU|nr:hypothetical protein J437_LFUL003876 [Ladona fulva]
MGFLHLKPLQKPLPLEPLPEKALEERRLWIGNLDSRITDKQFQQLMFLLSFLTVSTPQTSAKIWPYRKVRPPLSSFGTSCWIAERAKMALDGKLVGCKRIVLRWAHSISRP